MHDSRPTVLPPNYGQLVKKTIERIANIITFDVTSRETVTKTIKMKSTPKIVRIQPIGNKFTAGNDFQSYCTNQKSNPTSNTFPWPSHPFCPLFKILSSELIGELFLDKKNQAKLNMR